MLSTIRWFQQRFSYWVDDCILMDFVFLRGFVDLVLTHMISFRVLPPFASDYLECFALLHVAYVLSAAFPTFSLVRYLQIARHYKSPLYLDTACPVTRASLL